MNTVPTKADPKAKPEVKGKAEANIGEQADAKTDVSQTDIELLILQTPESQLEAIFERMQKAIVERRESKQAKAVEEIQKIAKDAGLTVMIRGVRKSSEGKLYQNPNNPEEQYNTNDGRKPKWLRDLVKSSGRKIHEFEVKTAPAEQKEGASA